MSESRVRENRMHGSRRRREAISASRASTRRAAGQTSRRPYTGGVSAGLEPMGECVEPTLPAGALAAHASSRRDARASGGLSDESPQAALSARASQPERRRGTATRTRACGAPGVRSSAGRDPA